MKKVILLLGVGAIYAFGAFMLGACGDNIPNPPVTIKLETKTKLVNSNPTKAGEEFEQSYTFDIADEFVKIYDLDINTVDSFKVESFTVRFNDTTCNKLSSYKATADFPVGLDSLSVTAENNCDFSDIADDGQVATLAFSQSKPGTNTTVRKILDADYANAIKNKKTVKIKFKMKAREALSGGFGIEVVLKSRIIINTK